MFLIYMPFYCMIKTFLISLIPYHTPNNYYVLVVVSSSSNECKYFINCLMKRIIFVPLQGYRCLECGDAFALEQSLVRHYSRRSLRIEVTCNQCTKRLAFFNKCSLLLHAREHKEKGLIMQCSHLVMKPVPVEQMIGQPDSTSMGR